MKIKVFAGLKEKVSANEVELSVVEDMTAEQLRHRIGDVYPELIDEVYMIAVNDEFVMDNHYVHPNDTVALIPPVSGG